jgi:hypothetical protein
LIEALDATEDTDQDKANDDDPIDDDEREPSLGSTDNARNQTHWAPPGPSDEDREGDEHDGREPDVDDEEDDPGEDNGDSEPSLGWTEAGTANSTSFITDGEQGSLSVAELDRIRAKRCEAAARERLADGGGDCRLVHVSRRPDGTICNVRALTPEEQARKHGARQLSRRVFSFRARVSFLEIDGE